MGNDIQSKVLAFAFGLAAEIERNLISQRTKPSLANLKASGIKLGRPLACGIKKAETVKEYETSTKIIVKKCLKIPNRQNPQRPKKHLETIY